MRCLKIILIILISVLTPNLPLITEFSFAQTSSAQKVEATRLLEPGLVLLNDREKYQEALQIIQQALVIFREIQDRGGEAKALQGIGDVYLSLNDYKKAIKFYQQQMTIGQQIGLGPPGALLNLGLIHLTIKDYPKAINYYEQILALIKNKNDCLGEKIALNKLGTALFLSGQLVAAEKRFWNAINISDKAQALRQAMLNTMKQHPDPKDWAAFTLIGTAE